MAGRELTAVLVPVRVHAPGQSTPLPGNLRALMPFTQVITLGMDGWGHVVTPSRAETPLGVRAHELGVAPDPGRSTFWFYRGASRAECGDVAPTGERASDVIEAWNRQARTSRASDEQLARTTRQQEQEEAARVAAAHARAAREAVPGCEHTFALPDGRRLRCQLKRHHPDHHQAVTVDRDSSAPIRPLWDDAGQPPPQPKSRGDCERACFLAAGLPEDDFVARCGAPHPTLAERQCMLPAGHERGHWCQWVSYALGAVLQERWVGAARQKATATAKVPATNRTREKVAANPAPDPLYDRLRDTLVTRPEHAAFRISVKGREIIAFRCPKDAAITRQGRLWPDCWYCRLCNAARPLADLAALLGVGVPAPAEPAALPKLATSERVNEDERPNGEPNRCVVCGDALPLRKFVATQRKFCSNRCRQKAYRTRQLASTARAILVEDGSP